MQRRSAVVYKPPSLRQKSLQFALISGVIVAVTIVLYTFNPATSSIYPPSPFRVLTGGLFCPGCGTLRGLHQLLHGNIMTAINLNVLMVLSIPFLAYSYFSLALEVITKRSLPKIFIKAQWIKALFYLIIAYWILRNIPYEPFSWLAP